MARLIMPAGGKATRFGGIIKELLPVDETGMTLLENTAFTGMLHFKIDEIAVLTNTFKEQYHKSVLDRSPVSMAPIHYIKGEYAEVWDAIKAAIDPDQDTVLLLPDTVINLGKGRVQITHDFMLGVFITEEPERFSTLSEGRIRTKVPSGVFAWGAVYWSAKVSKLLKESTATHYDEAFNEVIEQVGYNTFPIYEYNDLGSMTYYIRYIQGLTKA